HRPGHSAKGELAVHAILVLSRLLHVGGPEGHGGMILHVEEIGRLQVTVALVHAGVNAGCVYDGFDILDGAVVAEVNVSFKNLELATDGGNAEVADAEFEAAVGGFDGPAHGLLRFLVCSRGSLGGAVASSQF